MKTKNRIFLSILMIIVSACVKESDVLIRNSEGLPVNVTIKSSTATQPSSTKTSYDASHNMAYWKRTDYLGVVADYWGPVKTRTDKSLQFFQIQNISAISNNVEIAEFSGKLTDKGAGSYTFYALYPYSQYSVITNPRQVPINLCPVQFPSDISWDGSCDFLIAKPLTLELQSLANSKISLQFSRLFGCLEISFGQEILESYGEDIIDEVIIEDLSGTVMSGHFSVDITNSEPVGPMPSSDISSLSSSIKLDYRGKNYKLSQVRSYFILNPTSYPNVKITIGTNKHKIVCNRQNLQVVQGGISKATLNIKTGDIIQENNPLFPNNPSSYKVLLFGHSYGVDSMAYLKDLMLSAGISNVSFMNFVIGDCSLQRYWAEYEAGNKIPLNGAGEKTVLEGLQYTDWDAVVFQTSLGNEGNYSSFNPELGKLVNLAKQVCYDTHGKIPIIGWHMFWIGANRSPANYVSNIDAVKELLLNDDIQFVIPTGTAIQNLRETELRNDMDFTRDGSHLDEGIGRYAAACTWFETFIKPMFGVSVLGNDFIPSAYTFLKVTENNKELIQKAAVAAVNNMFETTLLYPNSTFDIDNPSIETLENQSIEEEF